MSYICCKPNIYKDFSNQDICLDGDIILFSIRDIKKGEEIFFNYGESYLRHLKIID